MNKDLKVVSSAEIETQTKQVSLVQTGDNATQIAHVGNYHDTSTTNLIIPTSISPSAVPLGRKFNREYYNLFVVGDEIFSQHSNFIIPKDKALITKVSKDIKSQIDTLHLDAIERIKSFPAIFASVNTVYGKSDDTQVAYFGFVESVRIQNNGIKISYYILNGIYQKRLNEIKDVLCIQGHEDFNELDETNWSVKKADLITVLRNANITVYA